MQGCSIHRSTVPGWLIWQFAREERAAGYPRVGKNRILIDERPGGAYFWIT